MSEMNEKKVYIWQLADFLSRYGMRMSGEELADHLGMVKTGGSDFHGKSKPQISLGEIAVPYRYFENLKRAVDRH